MSGSGFAPHSTVKVALYSEPSVLATTMTDGTGTFSVEVSMPQTGGPHTLVAAGTDSAGEARYLTLAVTVGAEHVALAAHGDAGGGVLAVTGDPVRDIAGTGAALIMAGVVLVGLARRPEKH
ncbi:hypothetical protein [Dactylosporangium sp. NPDC005555]|uniref:hypothetical protein n=1 Tax=Dactylosporangium sp. NPDC005555 TaxID=3154889 RepID=UPI0033A996D8